MRSRTPLREALAALLIAVMSAGWAQTERPLCSQVPAAERERARAAGLCRDIPVTTTPKVIETSPTVRALATYPVPELRGRIYDPKDERIARFRVTTSSRAGEQAKGWVLEQDPRPPERLAAGGPLKLVLSDGSLVRVPLVRGSDVAAAQAVLKRNGLLASIRDVAGEPKGRVLSQTPQEETPVKRGSPVTLGVAQGRTDDAGPKTEAGSTSTVSNIVPDLRGQLYNPNDERIARFRVVTSPRPGEQQRGWVLDQDPLPPKSLARGDELRVFLSDNSLVRVPRVSEETLANAQALLKRADLVEAVRDVPGAPKGRVLAQTPQENALVKRGTRVTLDVAAGAPPEKTPSLLPVPNVIGLGFDEARARLAAFSIERAYREALEPGGTVVDQDPLPPATRPAGAPVRVVLSDGSLVRVPRLIEMNIGDVRQRMAKSTELKLQTTLVDGGTRAGVVVGQDPAPGTVVKRGSPLRVQVTAGPVGPELIDVPNVVRLPLQRALARLERFKVDWREQPHRAPEGQVIAQSPPVPARAAPGSTVQLTVSSGPAPAELFELPSVVGRPFSDAQRVLAEFRVTRAPRESVAPRDEVLAQSPAAGAMISPGSTVALQVSDGSRVRVPDLAKMTIAAARSAVDGAGLRMQPEDAPADATIVAQQPTAGAEVRRGSAVQVEVVAAPPLPPPQPPQPPPLPPQPPEASPPAQPPVPTNMVPTLLLALGGAALLGCGALAVTPGGRSLLKRLTSRKAAPNVEVSARIDSELTEVTITGAEPSEPEIGISARLDPGTTNIDIEDQP